MTDFIDAQTGEVLPNTEDNIVVAFAQYQQAASLQEHWIRHRYMTEAQKKGIRARLSEAGGMAAWKEALQIAGKSEFLCGKIIGKTGRFKMDLNFLLRPSAFAKILDGFYTREEPTTRLVLPTLQTPAQRPAEPFKHDIETPEDRMAFTIASYRRRGKWADANRIEQQLADLQKRPALLVPAPDVAHLTGSASHATAIVPEKSPADREADRRRAFEAKNRANATDVPDWTTEPVPDSAYGED